MRATCSTIMITTCWLLQSVQATDVLDVENSKAVKTFVERYCVQCHTGGDAAAGLNLQQIDVASVDNSQQWDTTEWETIVRRLRSRQMPPVTADRPAEPEYHKTLQVLEEILDRSAEAFPRPGRTEAVRRLNRTEYQNAVRDLLAVDIDVEALLPPDPSGHGFDNVTVGELPPVLLSRYISAAEQIGRLAVGGQLKTPGGVTVRLPADRSQESHVEGLPLGTRGGTLLKHHFAVGGEYEIQLRLMRDRDENVEGLLEEHHIDVLVDRQPMHRFTVAPPKSGKQKGWSKDDTLVDANLRKRFRVSAGPHQVGVTFPRKFASLSEIHRQPFDTNFNRHRHPRLTPALFEVSIVGPFDPDGPGDTPSRQQVFTARPDKPADAKACAEQILGRLMRIAYRQPVDDDDLIVPMRFFQARFDADGFEAGIESALTAILVNPHFLFRAEVVPTDVPEGSVYRVSALELASRLSFLIWSSLPDDELLACAEGGSLRDPEVLKSQVERMLQDERSESLVTNFAAQWLYLRNLKSFRPDRRLFPDFDDNLRHALRRETELLFASVLQEDRSVLDLIRTDTTYLNERLAKHYGVPKVIGSHFRPVTVDQQKTHRGGLLRHGSILAVTSYATRTSPTIRGNWILENIMGTPAPPPPPNVPTLKDKTVAQDVTIRERLAEHRANPACASCHDLMDPIGFALENFDAVGRWRVFDESQPVDSVGALPDGRKISGLSDLESGIIERPEMFVGTLTEKLLTFALGRGIEPYDAPAIRGIVRTAAEHDNRFSAIVLGIASSKPFQMRTAE